MSVLKGRSQKRVLMPKPKGKGKKRSARGAAVTAGGELTKPLPPPPKRAARTGLVTPRNFQDPAPHSGDTAEHGAGLVMAPAASPRRGAPAFWGGRLATQPWGDKPGRGGRAEGQKEAAGTITYRDGALSPRKPGKGQVEQAPGCGTAREARGLTLHPPTPPARRRRAPRPGTSAPRWAHGGLPSTPRITPSPCREAVFSPQILGSARGAT